MCICMYVCIYIYIYICRGLAAPAVPPPACVPLLSVAIYMV